MQVFILEVMSHFSGAYTRLGGPEKPDFGKIKQTDG